MSRTAETPLFKKCWSEKYKMFRYEDVKITLCRDNLPELLRLESELLKHSPVISELLENIKQLFEVTSKGEYFIIKFKIADKKHSRFIEFEEYKTKLENSPNTSDTVKAIIDLFQINRRFKHFTSEEIIDEAVSIYNNKHRKVKFIQEKDCEPLRNLINDCLKTYDDQSDMIMNHKQPTNKLEEERRIFFEQKNLIRFFIKQISEFALRTKILESGKLNDYTKTGLATYLCCIKIGKELPEELTANKLWRKGYKILK
jgi:hypothetical protein